MKQSLLMEHAGVPPPNETFSWTFDGPGFDEHWGEHEARAGTECQHVIYGVFEFVKPVLNGKKILGNFKLPPPATQGDAGLNGNPNLRAFHSKQCFTPIITRGADDPLAFTADYTDDTRPPPLMVFLNDRAVPALLSDMRKHTKIEAGAYVTGFLPDDPDSIFKGELLLKESVGGIDAYHVLADPPVERVVEFTTNEIAEVRLKLVKDVVPLLRRVPLDDLHADRGNAIDLSNAVVVPNPASVLGIIDTHALCNDAVITMGAPRVAILAGLQVRTSSDGRGAPATVSILPGMHAFTTIAGSLEASSVVAICVAPISASTQHVEYHKARILTQRYKIQGRKNQPKHINIFNGPGTKKLTPCSMDEGEWGLSAVKVGDSARGFTLVDPFSYYDPLPVPFKTVMARLGGDGYLDAVSAVMAKSLSFLNHLSPLFFPGEDYLEQISSLARNT